MKRRLCLLLPSLFARPARAAPPAVTLLVELRWVDGRWAPAAQAGVRDGARVAGTAGAVSPRGPGTVTATAPPAPAPGQRLTVLNGQRAMLRLAAAAPPPQQVDAVVTLDPAGAVRRLHARPAPHAGAGAQAFTVTPTWPGGRAPVRVEFRVDEDGRVLQATRQLALGRWQAVAHVGGAAGGLGATAPPGTVSSLDAAGAPERELQLRVSVLP
ncbi:MAG: hypothetical protein QM788_07385 [Roseateles sp.]|uniref:hypothetical protein n=1 Tax=Roseateles sp. TaxID=1971397 RepID=UPI0039E7E80E